MTTSSLYSTHTIICNIPQLSSAFQTQIQPQRPGRFSNALQRRAPIGRWVKNNKSISLSMVNLLIALWMVYQYTQSLQRHRCPSYLSCRRGRKPLRDFTMRPLVTLKQFEYNVCDRRGWINNILVAPQY